MKTRTLLVLALAATPVALFAEKTPEPPVPVVEAPPRDPQQQPTEAGPAGEQRLYAPASSLVAPDKAKQVVDAFRAATTKNGAKAPRYLVYVNRELVDETSGLRITGRKEHTESVQGETKSTFETDPNAPKPATPPNGAGQPQVNVTIGNTTNGTVATTPGKGSNEGKGTRVTADNTYTFKEKTTGTLVDKQTVRDIERLFGRPLRAGGARLADQRTATALIADKPLDYFTTATNDAARKDREALANVADVVVEILVSTRTINVVGVSGTTTSTVPDIQATAIRLSDAAIIGQASATDVLGRDRDAGRIVRAFDVKDIAEATALALMEDISQTAN